MSKKGFTITIFGIGDYSSEEANNEKEMDDLVDFLKEEARVFRNNLQKKILEKKEFRLSSYLNNIELAESNDKYPDDLRAFR
ncbi:MAG: hypothetical protein ACQETJ_06510 [Bacteroidota bacterium]